MRGLWLATIVTAGTGSVVATQDSIPEHQSPAISPDGRRLVYTETRGNTSSIWIANSDGSGARHLKPDLAGRGRWLGNDSLWISGTGPDSGRVFVIGVDGGGRRVAATVGGRSPVVSPSGDLVGYLSGPWTSTALLIAKPDGSGPRRIAGGGATAWNHAWSPDGKWIAYTYGEAKGNSGSRVPLQVHLIRPDGTGDRAVTHTTADDGSAQMPAWSSDGKKLAVQVDHADRGGRLWILDLAGGPPRILNPHSEAYADEIPEWFPDGTRLAYQSNRSGRMEIWTINVDGTNAHQLTGRRP